MRARRPVLPVPGLLAVLLGHSCGVGGGAERRPGDVDPGADAGGGGGAVEAGADTPLDTPPPLEGGQCGAPLCSDDGTAVEDCYGKILEVCGADELCANGTCLSACEAAKASKSSVGCEYFATKMDAYTIGCFAVFVANTWSQPAKVEIDFGGTPLDPAAVARIPSGQGASLTYLPYDAAVGIAPGEVAILFLTDGLDVPCPISAPILPDAQISGTGRGRAFRVRTSGPVVAYQMLPYGGGSAAVTGATLLLPVSAWDTNYVAVNAYEQSQAAFTSPSMTLIAAEDGTAVTLLPKVAIAAGDGVPASPANVPVTFALNAGETLQFTQVAELTGSPISSSKPIGLFAGHVCLNVPSHAAYCDHAEQQIPPVRALGHRYAAATHRQRSGVPESPPYRIVGAVDGTELTFDPPVLPPTPLALGEVIEFETGTPFVVESQDDKHPFVLATYMTGSSKYADGYGDADFVRIVPAAQYLRRYVFFTDPTYPETNLVVLRRKGANGFADVVLDCAGPLTGFEPVGGTGEFELSRIDLVRHDFQGQNGCHNGRHVMSSDAPFGLWVWGWGTPETSIFTENVSYGYPAGESVLPINDVYVPPDPK